MKSENLLKNIYIVLMVILFALIISTPLLVRWQITILEEELKEAIEAGILFVLVTLTFTIRFLYKRKLKQREKELDKTLNYIGAVNLQVDQIKSIFDTIIRYPESKKDFKYLFESLADKVLAVVNCEWVLFRIIDSSSGKTLTEYPKARGLAVLLKYEIKNNELLENKILRGHHVVSSMQENFNIKVFCVMPIRSLDENQEVLLRAIVNNLGMLYLIFESVEAKPWNRA
jgi:hypothetical protein